MNFSHGLGEVTSGNASGKKNARPGVSDRGATSRLFSGRSPNVSMPVRKEYNDDISFYCGPEIIISNYNNLQCKKHWILTRHLYYQVYWPDSLHCEIKPGSAEYRWMYLAYATS